MATIKQVFSYPFNFISGRVKKSMSNVTDIKSGEGAIVDIEGKKVAVYKNENGEILKFSPVCTHLGCIVGWDKENKNWLCPCHGSKYAPGGTVIQGPAKKNLNRIS